MEENGCQASSAAWHGVSAKRARAYNESRGKYNITISALCLPHRTRRRINNHQQQENKGHGARNEKQRAHQIKINGGENISVAAKTKKTKKKKKKNRKEEENNYQYQTLIKERKKTEEENKKLIPSGCWIKNHLIRRTGALRTRTMHALRTRAALSLFALRALRTLRRGHLLALARARISINRQSSGEKLCAPLARRAARARARGASSPTFSSNHNFFFFA